MTLDERLVDRWLSRGHRFFRAVTRNGVIRGTLRGRGLSDDELRQGWQLYSTALGLNPTGPALPPTTSEAASAMAEIDEWDAPNFNAARAVLDYSTPKASAFLFEHLAADQGPKAVVAVKTFLNRWEQLRTNKADGVSKKEATEAVEKLGSRRIVDVSIAEHLRALIARAEQGAELPGGVDVAQAAANEDDEAAFAQYQNWLNEWREVARATFKRRDYLIMLGLASRRGPSADADADADADEEDGETEQGPPLPAIG